MTQQKSNRGGLRNPAGGRPAAPAHLRRVRCGDITLSPWARDWLKANRSRERPMGELIEAALTGYYGIKPPG